ncbi:MAG: patatin family protein [Clostridiaceae bacterium]|nr:patatin family protein [Clostridiaceae bacterium]
MDGNSKLKSNVFDTALIFEGGGMRACYTAGFVSMLLEHDIYFNYVAGISAGASHAVNYLSRDFVRARRSFTDIVQDPSFGDLSSWIKGDGYFNADYIYSKSPREDGMLPFDFDAFSKNEAECVVGAFLRYEGDMVYWHKNDMSTMDDLIIRIRASSSVPFLMPETEIDGKIYVDGGLGGGIPLDIAMEDGYDRFVIVLTRERGFRLDPIPQLRLMSRVLDRHPAEREALMTRHLRYNQLLDTVEQLEGEGRACVFYPEHIDLSMIDRDREKLLSQYLAGHEQATRELPRLRAFLGG